MAASGTAASGGTAGRMAGKVAVITGGASGIGRACGLRFAAEGASIVVADLNPDRAAHVVSEINELGRDAVAVQVDTSDQEQNDAMADAAVDAFGRIDACVAAAGISHSDYVSREIEEQAGQDRFDRGDLYFIDKSLESWQRVLDVNLTGVMLTNQAVARKMKDNGGGAIVNISSIAGTNVLKGSSDCCAARLLRVEGRRVDADTLRRPGAQPLQHPRQRRGTRLHPDIHERCGAGQRTVGARA